MDGNAERKQNTDEFGEAQFAAYAERLPTWENRDLSSEYIDDKKNRANLDTPFLALTLIILMLGVIMVLSASFARSYYMSGQPLLFFRRQIIFAALGVVLMLVVSNFPVSTMRRWSLPLLIVSIAMLVLVLIIGIELNGAKRWLGIGSGNNSFTFQPSEIAKVALIISSAQMSCSFGKKMKTFKYGVIPFISITTVMVVLLWREPHISAIMIILALTVIMMFAGGTHIKWFIFALAALLVVAGILYAAFIKAPSGASASEDITLSQVVSDNGGSMGYAGRRISAWLDPEADPLGHGLQIRQSLFAVGSGGLLGQGLGKSRQKYLYLPEEHNDYIFAIVCEELGYVGALLILILFVLLILRGFWLALHARDKFSSLITIGISSLLAIQVFLNVAVVINLIPATGISLPFFSSGGTALLIQLAQMGVILAVSREIPAEEGAGARG